LNIKALLEKCSNANFRIGLSGSQHDNECDRLTVEGNFGPILSVVSASELMDKGFISNVDVYQIMLEYPEVVRKHLREYKKSEGGMKAYVEEKKAIQFSDRRRSLVQKLIEKRGNKENILLLFDELEFGESTFNELQLKFPDRKCYYIAGDVKADVREEIRVNVNEEEGAIVVASLGTFSTGINLPKIHSLIFLFVGKSKIRLQQSVGRILRLHVSKDKARVFDIVDMLPYSKGHGMIRLQFYLQEGFPVQTYEIKNKS
jgi:superfamily II DNA or RNA helicase